MNARTAVLAALVALAPAAAACEAPPQQQIERSRELPDPQKYVADWKGYKKLGLAHMETGYKMDSVERGAYHFDAAIFSFRRAKELREDALDQARISEAPKTERETIEAEIALLQRHLEHAIKDKPGYYGPRQPPRARR